MCQRGFFSSQLTKSGTVHAFTVYFVAEFPQLPPSRQRSVHRRGGDDLDNSTSTNASIAKEDKNWVYIEKKDR